MLTADLALGQTASWTAASLPEVLISVLQKRFCDLRVVAEMDTAQLVAEIAQQMQNRSDVTATNCGVHARNTEKHTATIFFSFMDEFLAEAVLRVTVQLVTHLTNPELTPQQLMKLLHQGLDLTVRAGLDQSTQLILTEAERRGIPWFRISRLSRHIQLGQGKRQRRTFETLRSAESPIGRDLSRDKLISLQMLGQLGLPVGRYEAVRDVNAALKAAEKIGYPVVLKPVFGKQGISVYSKLLNAEELRAAYAKVAGQGQFLVQSFFAGDDHRILIVDGKLISAAKRIAACVTGDGIHTIKELVEEANKDPRRAQVFDNVAKPIPFDDETDRMLAHQGHTRDSVPAEGEYVRMRLIANTSNGGMAVDVTHTIHPDNARAAIKAALALELTVAGVGFIVGDITKSWREVGGGICEVNSIVGLRVHMLANADIDVVGPIIETIFPNRNNGRILTAMIAGANGNATAALIVKDILTCAGHDVGLATAKGVSVGDEPLTKGDFAGVAAAHMVMRDPTVTAAVLETSRAGLLESGAYLDRCDVSALLGNDGIQTFGEAAAPLRRMLETANQAVVLNAEDPLCASLAQEFSGSVRTILYAMDGECGALRQHIDNGGDGVFSTAAGVGEIVIVQGKTRTSLIAKTELPSHDISNLLAAVGIALGLGLSHDQIRRGLEAVR